MGILRTTHDLDFVLQLPPSQVTRFTEAFASEDYFVDEAMVRSAYQPLKVDFWILKPDAFAVASL